MTETKKPLSGKKVLIYFIAFFGLVMIMDAIFISIAMKTHTGVVTEQAYERGLALNKWDDAAKQNSHMTADVKINARKIGFYLEDAEKNIITDADIKVHGMLFRNDKTDFKLPLKYVADGWYETDLIWPQHGQWDLYFTATTPSGSLYKKETYRYAPR